MEIYPAIDIKDGKAVRLFKGDYDKVTEYSDSPLAVAESIKAVGASNLHIVDLDGAKDGTLANFDTVKAITNKCGLFCEIGGGIRNEERIEAYLNCGVKRVIIGTAAIKDPEFLERAIKEFKGYVAVGVDANDGKVAIDGWKTITDVDSYEFCGKLRDKGVETVIYTDISRDGTLAGTNMDAYKELGKIKGLNVIASGGITYIDEIVKLKEMKVYGAILGKVLYEKRLDLKEVLKVARC